MSMELQALGGEAGLATVVEDCLHRARDDERLAAWFAGVDTAALAARVAPVLARLLVGGPVPSERLRAVHAALVQRGLGDEDFDALMYHFCASLEARELPMDRVARCARILEGVRRDVLGR